LPWLPRFGHEEKKQPFSGNLSSHGKPRCKSCHEPTMKWFLQNQPFSHTASLTTSKYNHSILDPHLQYTKIDSYTRLVVHRGVNMNSRSDQIACERATTSLCCINQQLTMDFHAIDSLPKDDGTKNDCLD
jgi:hypothetical protein